MTGSGLVEDRRLADAYFLHNHPGWTWHDLQDTPADIVRLIRLIERKETEAAEGRRRAAEAVSRIAR